MKITWNESLARARRGFFFSSLALLLSFPMIGHDNMDSWATFFISLSSVILAASAIVWACASYFTRDIRAFFWITRRLGVFFAVLLVAGLAAIKIYPSPDGSWPTTGDAVVITAAVGFLALLIAGAVNKRLSHPTQGA